MRASGGRSPGRRSVHRVPDRFARSGRAPAPPPSPLECPPRKPARRTRGAAPRPRVPRPAPPATPLRFARTGRDRQSRTRASTPVTTASPLAAIGQVRRRTERVEGKHPTPRVQQRPALAPAGERHRRRLVELDPERARQPAADLRPPSRPAWRAPGAPAGPGSSNTLAFGESLQRADHVRRIKILQSGDLHPSDPEKIETAQQFGKPEPEREPQPEAAEDLPAGFQAAPSHRTSSGPTRVMSPAPSVRTTSPGSSAS